MIVEGLIKIGSSNTGDRTRNWLDGQLITWLARGFGITGAQYSAWLADQAAEPSRIGLLQPGQQSMHRRRRNELAALTSPAATPSSIARRMFLTSTPTADQIAEASARMSRAAADVAMIVANGYDTNWGFRDLMVHAAVMLDLEAEELRELSFEPFDLTVDPLVTRRLLARRSWRIPYETLATARQVADWQDATLLVPLDRSMTPWNSSQVMGVPS